MGGQSASNPPISSIPQMPLSQQAPAAKPNYDPFGSLASTQPISQARVASPAISSQPPQQPHRPADPFAALSSQTPRQGSPFQFQQSIKPPASPSAGLLDLAQPSTQPPRHSQPTEQQRNSRRRVDLRLGAARSATCADGDEFQCPHPVSRFQTRGRCHPYQLIYIEQHAPANIGVNAPGRCY